MSSCRAWLGMPPAAGGAPRSRVKPAAIGSGDEDASPHGNAACGGEPPKGACGVLGANRKRERASAGANERYRDVAFLRAAHDLPYRQLMGRHAVNVIPQQSAFTQLLEHFAYVSSHSRPTRRLTEAADGEGACGLSRPEGGGLKHKGIFDEMLCFSLASLD